MGWTRSTSMVGLWVVSLGAVAHAERPRLALLAPEAVNIEAGQSDRFARTLRRIASKGERFTIVPAADVARATADRPSGCGRQIACLRTVGRRVGADLLLAPRVGRLGSTVVVQLSAFDVKRGARSGRWEEVLRGGGAVDIEGALRRMFHNFAPLPRVERPWYKRWWVWTAVGVAVAGAVTATVLAATVGGGQDPDHIIQPPLLAGPGLAF